MPLKFSKRMRCWIPLFFGLVVTAGLLAPLPRGGRMVGALGNGLHGPMFAVLAFFVFRAMVGFTRLGPRAAAWLTGLSLVAFGAATEVAQYWVGRNFSLTDVVADGLGAVAGTLAAIAWGHPSRRSRRILFAFATGLIILCSIPAALTLVDTALQRRDFPVIGSFEQPLERIRWQTWWARPRRCREHATDGAWSLRVDLRPGDYPGIGTGVPGPDWSRYTELVFDIELDEGPPLDWLVKIADEGSDHTPADGFQRTFCLKPGRQRIVIPLADLQRGPRSRRLDLRQICSLHFFAVDLKNPRTIFLDNIRLR